MKICVAGSRDFVQKTYVNWWLEQNFFIDQDILLNGNCPDGVDAWALKWAQPRGAKILLFDPDWTRWGKRAGPIRNEEMLKEADKVICFWNGQSPGTKSTIEFALKYKKDLEVIFG